MGKTGISWTDEVWNCVRGCSRVSEGCRHCYAESMAARIVRMGKGKSTPYDGLVKTVRRMGDFGTEVVDMWTGEVAFDAEKLADPLRWKKPRRIFVNSMSDLFHEKLTNEQIAAVFGVMAACPQHAFQVLTKRARRMREWFEWAAVHGAASCNALAGGGGEPDAWKTVRGCALHAEQHVAGFDRHSVGVAWPLPNVWIGVSVENQDAADERIPELRNTPAAVRFLSIEPMLGPVWIPDAFKRNSQAPATWRPPIDWVIAGCESGPGARPCDVAWLRSLRDQCAEADVPFFLKQASDAIAEVTTSPGSKRKPGGVIELPYLDGVQHAAMPRDRST